MQPNHKILLAAGGTGGHLFPAQALAEQLQREGVNILFAGAGLEQTTYFDRKKFAYRSVVSATPFRGSVRQRLRGLLSLARGVWQSYWLLFRERPALVVGFGSFHAFPVLLAAVLRRVPLVLFEANAVPGKVVRLFSRYAQRTAVYFPQAATELTGQTTCVALPTLKTQTRHYFRTAREVLGLQPDLVTLLVFGGSQGAQRLNQLVLQLLPHLSAARCPIQLIHLTGDEAVANEISRLCMELSIPVCAKKFEQRMDLLWSAADLVLCRSGAATVSEVMHYEVPALFIPYPYAAERHQSVNAAVVAQSGGALVLEESDASPEHLQELLAPLLTPDSLKRNQMRRALQACSSPHQDLATLIFCHLDQPPPPHTPYTYHFLGIGGIGMSALAHILLQKGHAVVSGTDIHPSPITEALRLQGAQLFWHHAAAHVPKQGCLIYSTDIKQGNPEFTQAAQTNLICWHRSQLLAELMRAHRPLLIAGSHGKTTTSALLAYLLLYSQLSPSFAVGGILKNVERNGGYGQGDYFVAEADESDGSFLDYSPFGAIVTNIGNDHLDHWKDMESLVQGFAKFAQKTHSAEHLFWCGDDPLLQALQLPGFSYGCQEHNALQITSLRQEGWKNIFSLRFHNQSYLDIEVPLVGVHNVFNSAAVFGLGLQLHIPEEKIRAAFHTFRGIARRVEPKGEIGSIPVFDDYAHHPTEIATTLHGIKEALQDRRLCVVFQPHRYTRTKECLAGFGPALQAADLLIVTDIYAAREAPIENITTEALLTEIRKVRDKPAHYAPKAELAAYVKAQLLPGDVVVTMGAGDITQLGAQLVTHG